MHFANIIIFRRLLLLLLGDERTQEQYDVKIPVCIAGYTETLKLTSNITPKKRLADYEPLERRRARA